MAAETIANGAWHNAFKMELATIVNECIGENERNLKAVFGRVELTDAILFSDEADALFGERSEVSDFHDRYANLEVSYLQRMEEHDGAVILASNFKKNINDAFLRWIDLNVEFPRPDREARAEIWETIFSEETPVGDLDIAFLSSFEITGGNIKNVALTASFLGADDDATETVEMDHVVRALVGGYRRPGGWSTPESSGSTGTWGVKRTTPRDFFLLYLAFVALSRAVRHGELHRFSSGRRRPVQVAVRV
jgi:SpoVK/Ycf46/Vps4 family AAA+-type ATPase